MIFSTKESATSLCDEMLEFEVLEEQTRMSIQRVQQVEKKAALSVERFSMTGKSRDINH